MLKKGTEAKPEDANTPEEEIKDPFVLEFLNLKDEYSENDLESMKLKNLGKLVQWVTSLHNPFTFRSLT